MPAFRDLTGQRFGRLVVDSLAVRAGRGTTWHCRCDCGENYIAIGRQLYQKDRFSCGCLQRANPASKTTANPTWQTWWDMLRRCFDLKHASFKHYGGRGITVCERWRTYENFLTDHRPAGLTLDRIDNERGYEPGNCRWATASEQGRNRRTAKLIEINGVTKNLVAWLEDLGVAESLYRQRVTRGLSPQEALLSPKQRGGRNPRPLTFNGKTQGITFWAVELGISLASLHERLDRHPLEVALSSRFAELSRSRRSA